MSPRDFLVEIGTEELPPKALAGLSESLEHGIVKGLNGEQLNFSASQRYATPRRLAVLIRELQAQQPDRDIDRLGPTISAAFDQQGKPTKAAQGFARSCGVAVNELDRSAKGGVEKLATIYKKEFLGKIPIDIDLRVAADTGKPLVEKKPDHKISKIFIEIAKKIKGSFL